MVEIRFSMCRHIQRAVAHEVAEGLLGSACSQEVSLVVLQDSEETAESVFLEACFAVICVSVLQSNISDAGQSVSQLASLSAGTNPESCASLGHSCLATGSLAARLCQLSATKGTL